MLLRYSNLHSPNCITAPKRMNDHAELHSSYQTTRTSPMASPGVLNRSEKIDHGTRWEKREASQPRLPGSLSFNEALEKLIKHAWKFLRIISDHISCLHLKERAEQEVAYYFLAVWYKKSFKKWLAVYKHSLTRIGFFFSDLIVMLPFVGNDVQ